MPRTIITHVGVSVLTCAALYDAAFDIGQLRDDLLSGRDRIYDDQLRRRNPDSLTLCSQDLIEGLRRIWEGHYDDDQKRRDSPAEIASLSLLKPVDGDQVLLLHSDTPDGRFCAHLLRNALIDSSSSSYDNGVNSNDVNVKGVKGLRVSDLAQSEEAAIGTSTAFIREGLSSYIDIVWNAYNDLDAESEDRVVFNITSGYKGIIPIARDIAVLLAAHSREKQSNLTAEVCYLYEDSKALIHYDARLPVLWDKTSIPVDSLKAADREGDGVNIKDIETHFDFYFDKPEDGSKKRHRSPLGEVVWQLYRRLYHGYISLPSNE